MKKLLAVFVLFGATSAFANVSIECGEHYNKDTGSFDQRKFLIASEDGGKAQVYDANDKLIRGAKLTQGENQTLVLTITHAKSTTGPVGVKFVIQDYRGQDFVKAEEFIMGGFAGGVHRKTLICSVVEL